MPVSAFRASGHTNLMNASALRTSLQFDDRFSFWRLCGLEFDVFLAFRVSDLWNLMSASAFHRDTLTFLFDLS